MQCQQTALVIKPRWGRSCFVECSLQSLLYHLMFRQWFVSAPLCQWAPSWNRLQKMKYGDGEVSLVQQWTAAMFPESFSMQNLGGRCNITVCSLPRAWQCWVLCGWTPTSKKLHSLKQNGSRYAGAHKEMAKWQSASQTGCRASSNLQARLSVGKLTKSTAMETLCGCLQEFLKKKNKFFSRNSSLQGVH